jgi:hypothetical protein
LLEPVIVKDGEVNGGRFGVIREFTPPVPLVVHEVWVFFSTDSILDDAKYSLEVTQHVTGGQPDKSSQDSGCMKFVGMQG